MTLAQVFTIKEFTGRHMLAVIGLFFGTIITVNMVLAWFAVNSWSGLVAKNGYVASIEFKDKQADVERQRLLGWKSQMKLASGHLLFSIKDAAGKAITGLSIVGSAGRLVTEKDDRNLKFRAGKPGEYLALAPKQPGQWRIDVLATNAENQTYRKLYRVLVKVQ